jgi:hypothetical protein
MAKGESKVNYKAGGRHWVIDSGCTNHMTGERKIFSHLVDDTGQTGGQRRSGQWLQQPHNKRSRKPR